MSLIVGHKWLYRASFCGYVHADRDDAAYKPPQTSDSSTDSKEETGEWFLCLTQSHAVTPAF